MEIMFKMLGQGNYYLKSNGKMAVNERTPDGYRVDASGKWIR